MKNKNLLLVHPGCGGVQHTEHGDGLYRHSALGVAVAVPGHLWGQCFVMNSAASMHIQAEEV